MSVMRRPLVFALPMVAILLVLGTPFVDIWAAIRPKSAGIDAWPDVPIHVGVIDDLGYVSIVGRSKDLIISGGYNVYPAEIEGVCNEMPGVAETAVEGLTTNLPLLRSIAADTSPCSASVVLGGR